MENIFNHRQELQQRPPIVGNGGDNLSVMSYNSSEEPARYTCEDFNYQQIVNSDRMDTKRDITTPGFVNLFNQRLSSRKDTDENEGLEEGIKSKYGLSSRVNTFEKWS